MSLITEYRDWVDEPTLRNLWGSTVCQPHWFFGQKSNNDTVYPMWGQAFFDTFNGKWKHDTNEYIITAGENFLNLIGEEYLLVRSMLAGNTFGQDGDIH